MKFWQSLAFCELEQAVDLAKFAEELGFYGVSFGDHLVTTQSQVDEYFFTKSGQVMWHPETHWPDPWVISAALARETSRLRFLTTVYVLPMRDTFVAAKAVSTAAYLSDDRVILGVGIGWQKTEFELTGQDFHTRGKRVDEQLEVLRGLMSGEMVEYHGRFHDFPPLRMSPGTRRQVPVFVGGTSDAALCRAARHDGWLGLRHAEEELAGLMARLRRVRGEAGSLDRPFEVWTAISNPGPGAFERAEALGVTMTNGPHFLVDGKVQPSDIGFKKRRMEEFARRHIHASCA